MSTRAWAIKLGSGGRCVDFCEARSIVGVGWQQIDPGVLATGNREQLFSHVKAVCSYYKTDGERRRAAAQIFRFARECRAGDFILYYVPVRKQVVICRVKTDCKKRDFDLEDGTDVWLHREVEILRRVPLLDFHGALKGRLLGPRMSFWEMRGTDLIKDLVEPPPQDPALESAWQTLRQLVVRRAEALTDSDWEWVLVDYFKAQGGHVDERRVGGSHAVIDVEAVFDHGELGDEVWRIQVKRYQGKKVDWPEIEAHIEAIGDARFCFASVFGFTDLARAKADEEDVLLLEAGDFVLFFLSGKLRPALRVKLQLPTRSSS